MFLCCRMAKSEDYKNTLYCALYIFARSVSTNPSPNQGGHPQPQPDILRHHHRRRRHHLHHHRCQKNL
jgi:hypothetical protein